MSALTDVFTSIANAIRAKAGVQTTYKPSEMATAIANLPSAVTKEVVNLVKLQVIQGSTPIQWSSSDLFMFEEDLVRVNAMSEGSNIQVCCSATIEDFVSALNSGTTRTIYKVNDQGGIGYYVDSIDTTSQNNRLLYVEVVDQPTSGRRFFVIYTEGSQSVTFTYTIKTYRDGTKYYYWVSSVTASKPLLTNHTFRLKSSANGHGSLTIEAGSTTKTENRPYDYQSSSGSPTSMKVFLDGTQIATISVQYTSRRENTYSNNTYATTDRVVKFKP